MDTFLRNRRKAPQRRTMDARWAEAELDKEWGTFLLLAAKSWKADAAALRMRLPNGAWALGRAGLNAPDMGEVEALEAALGAPLAQVPDLARDGDWAPLKEKGWRSLAALSLTDEEGPAGSLWLLGSEPRASSEDDDEALALLADQAAHLHRL